MTTTVTIGGASIDVPPFGFRKIRQASPILDRARAFASQAASGGEHEGDLEPLMDSAYWLLKAVVIATNPAGLTPDEIVQRADALADRATTEEMIALVGQIGDIIAEVRGKQQPGEDTAAPEAPAAA